MNTIQESNRFLCFLHKCLKYFKDSTSFFLELKISIGLTKGDNCKLDDIRRKSRNNVEEASSD